MDFFDSRRQTDSDNAQNDRTVLNPNAQEAVTSLNLGVQNGTVLNPSVNDGTGYISPGTVVCGKYVIQNELDVATGEANLFICTCDGQKYVAKVYRRKMAIKPDVANSLAQIHSPYVARIFDMGDYEGYPVEILPYYRNGSLAGRTFTLQQLQEDIIPSLNEGLKVLHDNGIIHKDLKPSNIMLNDDGRSVSIIDFGISTVTRDGNTVVVTHTGLTPEYSAPETFRGLFLAESDYYSLGITVFELYAGHSPYDGMTQEQIAQFAVIQKVPLPNDMDPDLKALITGVTYNDITNRKDKKNPNRRWAYEEVQNWCKGIPQPIPGASAGGTTVGGEFRAYRFQGQSYDTMDGLITALGTDWENGKKQLFRGTLGGHFNSIDADIADICGNAQDEMDEGKKSADLVFFETLYKLDPEIGRFFWKGYVFESLDDLAQKLLSNLRENRSDMDTLVDEVLTNGLLSSYIRAVDPEANEQIRVMESFESGWRTFHGTDRERIAANYQLGFMLSKEKTLVVDGQKFQNPDQIVSYMAEHLDQSYEEFDVFCRKLLNEKNELDIQFECWLVALGKKQAVEEWQKEMTVA